MDLFHYAITKLGPKPLPFSQEEKAVFETLIRFGADVNHENEIESGPEETLLFEVIFLFGKITQKNMLYLISLLLDNGATVSKGDLAILERLTASGKIKKLLQDALVKQQKEEQK